MKKSEIIVQLVQTKEFTTNAIAKEILSNAIRFIKKA